MELTGKRLLYIGGNDSIADIANYTKIHGITLLTAGKVISEEMKYMTSEHYITDVSDRNSLEKIVTEHHIDGILVIGNEDIISCVVDISEKVGIEFYVNQNQWIELQNKKNFKKNCVRYGIPVIETFELTDENDAAAVPENIFPVMLKPADSCGSKGISICYSKDQLAQAIRKAKSFSRTGTFLCEKYVDCPEITIKYLFDRGNIYLWEVNDRYVNREQKSVGAIADGTVYPSKYVQLYLDTMHLKMVDMLRNFKMYNGTMFVQAFVEDGVIKPYDPGIRFSGGLSYFITNHVFNVNPLELMINAALTGKMYLGDSNPIEKIRVDMNGRYLANYSILARVGTLTEINGLDTVMQMPEVFKTLQLLHVGDEVKMIGTLQQVFARFQIEAKSRERLDEIIKNIYQTIQLTDQDGGDMKLRQTIDII